MPGNLITGHADLEVRCENCHIRFDKAAQNRLCLDCHKPVAADVKSGKGFHGRLAEKTCRDCHTDHKGRGARIVVLDEKKFDHGKTDFALTGKHRQAKCSNCHRPTVKHSQAPMECIGCHRKDDKHRGGLGRECANCHHDRDWKDARFDHGKTKFPLRQQHADVPCTDCHINHNYADTARECISCHRKDDAHKGRFGARCESCHNESRWESSTFRHDKDTRYPLLDRHRAVKCQSCHTQPLYKEKLGTRCVTCHRDDDTHKNSLGDRCEKCHDEKGWNKSRFDHKRDTKFPLLDKHASAKCDACHKDPALRDKLPLACNACHQRDDEQRGHRGKFGEKCEACHDARSFKPATFEHTRDTSWPLSGKHRQTKCETCHKGTLHTTKTETSCISCHEKDDVHFGSFDLKCERCHVADDWRKIIKDGKSSADSRSDGRLAPGPKAMLRRVVSGL